MDADKRKLILAEIERWRRSKLLPEHYCDFLRNLYLEGETDAADPAPWQRFGRRMFAGLKPGSRLVLLGVFGAILLVSLYFTFFHFLLQTFLSLLLVILLIGIGLGKQKQNPVLGFAALGGGNVLALLLGLVMLKQYGIDEPGGTVALVAASGLIWIGSGLAARIGLLQFCGYFALLLSYLWLIQSWHPQPGFWLLQLYLLPVAALLYGMGSWIYGGRHSAGAMLMFAAGVALVAPELFGLAFTGMSVVLAVPVLLGKLAVAASVIWRRSRPARDTDWIHDFD